MCTKTLFKQVKMLVSSIFNSWQCTSIWLQQFKKNMSKKFLNFTHMSVWGDHRGYSRLVTRNLEVWRLLTAGVHSGCRQAWPARAEIEDSALSYTGIFTAPRHSTDCTRMRSFKNLSTLWLFLFFSQLTHSTSFAYREKTFREWTRTDVSLSPQTWGEVEKRRTG